MISLGEYHYRLLQTHHASTNALTHTRPHARAYTVTHGATVKLVCVRYSFIRAFTGILFHSDKSRLPAQVCIRYIIPQYITSVLYNYIIYVHMIMQFEIYNCR